MAVRKLGATRKKKVIAKKSFKLKDPLYVQMIIKQLLSSQLNLYGRLFSELED